MKKLDNLKLIGNNILIKKELAPDKVGHIFVPETAKDERESGIARIIKTGTGYFPTKKSKKRLPFDVGEGDRVLTFRWGGEELEIDGEIFHMISNDGVLAILPEATQVKFEKYRTESREVRRVN